MHFHPRLSLGSFLATAKKTLAGYNVSHPVPPILAHDSWTFVIGNESADLDSLCSAVVMAYLLTSFSKRLYIPLSNIPRSDLPLRRELSPVLPPSLIPDDLLTLSDLPKPLPSPELTRWILVDHNALTGDLGRLYRDRVIGCIDHHKEEGSVPFGPHEGEGLEHEPRIIQEAGSCSSLVVAWARHRRDPTTMSRANEYDLSFAKGAHNPWDAHLARLALGPILIDTTCLKSLKTTADDIAMTTFLEDFIKQDEGATYNRDMFFDQITTAKEDLSSFSLAQILRKDYKQWDDDEPQVPGKSPCNLGSSSVVKPIAYLLDKAGSKSSFLSALLKLMHERNIALFALMTTSRPHGHLHRELLVWARGEQGVRAAQRFEFDAGPILGLERCSDPGMDLETLDPMLEDTERDEKMWWRYWKQKNVENSRKQVAPLLRNAIRRSEGLKL
ncbi:hypothetical protein K3495_g8397 [Podosphaera aphanis]|nr:hypothetical protein K3495_g8397 [Podosphaera aphanis]